jgi:DNA-binding MarR family transcriptional regulator
MEAVVLALREHNTAAVMFHGAVAARFRLSVTDLKALDLLERVGPLTAGEMATETRLAAASVTSLIDRLARKRFVRRRRDPRDRRRVIVALDPNLSARLAVVFRSLHRSTLERVEQYSDADLRVILSFLTRSASDTREETGALTNREFT